MEIEFTIYQIIFISVFLIINIIAFVYMGVDKTKAVANYSRVPEAHLLFLAICFCALGVWLGMIVFRHKTRKLYFSLGIPIALIQNLVFLYFLILVIKDFVK